MSIQSIKDELREHLIDRVRDGVIDAYITGTCRAYVSSDRAWNCVISLETITELLAEMEPYTSDEFDQFHMSYVQTALWSSTNPDNDEPLDNGDYELSDEVESEMLADCEAFLAAHADTIRECVTTRNNNSSNFTMAGHDFWLTRCGHGAGFWDGDYSEPHATILTDASDKAGNVELYVGDDGKIYS